MCGRFEMKFLFQHLRLWILPLAILVAFTLQSLVACPFCPALKPTLAQQREECDWLVFAEVAEDSKKEKAKLSEPVSGGAIFTVHKILKQPANAKLDATVTVTKAPAMKPGKLVMLFGTTSSDKTSLPDWDIEGVTELGAAYVMKMPDLRRTTPERLLYYVKYLESSDAAAR